MHARHAARSARTSERRVVDGVTIRPGSSDRPLAQTLEGVRRRTGDGGPRAPSKARSRRRLPLPTRRPASSLTRPARTVGDGHAHHLPAGSVEVSTSSPTNHTSSVAPAHAAFSEQLAHRRKVDRRVELVGWRGSPGGRCRPRARSRRGKRSRWVDRESSRRASRSFRPNAPMFPPAPQMSFGPEPQKDLTWRLSLTFHVLQLEPFHR